MSKSNVAEPAGEFLSLFVSIAPEAEPPANDAELIAAALYHYAPDYTQRRVDTWSALMDTCGTNRRALAVLREFRGPMAKSAEVQS